MTTVTKSCSDHLQQPCPPPFKHAVHQAINYQIMKHFWRHRGQVIVQADKKVGRRKTDQEQKETHLCSDKQCEGHSWREEDCTEESSQMLTNLTLEKNLSRTISSQEEEISEKDKLATVEGTTSIEGVDETGDLRGGRGISSAVQDIKSLIHINDRVLLEEDSRIIRCMLIKYKCLLLLLLTFILLTLLGYILLRDVLQDATLITTIADTLTAISVKKERNLESGNLFFGRPGASSTIEGSQQQQLSPRPRFANATAAANAAALAAASVATAAAALG